MREKFSIKNQLFIFAMICFAYFNFYFFFNIFSANEGLKIIIDHLDIDKGFFIFMKEFDSPNILFSAAIFLIVSIILTVTSFLASQHNFKFLSYFGILASTIFTFFILSFFYSDSKVLTSSISIVEKVTSDESLMNNKESNSTTAFLKNTKEYLETYKKEPNLENKIKYLTSFEILAFNLDKVKTVNADNAAFFTKIVKLHVKKVMHYNYLLRTLTIFSIFLVIFNLVLLKQINRK